MQLSGGSGGVAVGYIGEVTGYGAQSEILIRRAFGADVAVFPCSESLFKRLILAERLRGTDLDHPTLRLEYKCSEVFEWEVWSSVCRTWPNSALLRNSISLNQMVAKIESVVYPEIFQNGAHASMPFARIFRAIGPRDFFALRAKLVDYMKHTNAGRESEFHVFPGTTTTSSGRSIIMYIQSCNILGTV